MRLLLVDGNEDAGAALADALTPHRHTVVRSRWGMDLLTSHHEYDAILLDPALADISGLRALRQLRTVSSIPVVVLTDPDDERSVVLALHSGADDCVTKPPRIRELVARLERAIRAHVVHSLPHPTGVVVTGDVHIDLNARRVVVGGTPIALTHKQFELIRILVECPGQAVSRQQLMDRVWGDAVTGVSRSLDVHITWLRSKLGRPGLITTVRGFGYRWAAVPAVADAAS
ncbi:response regulator transcription factor [Nocardia sp. NEAU-G5]|uniref:Sensory transduction protein RegX3 n=1 Tax=Nocardia albiluteola TaxID=2842303 RepID=A0ABS6BCC2_9NOCA|nr:response regulator transcription factor [Nocardia albiluteola]MBU3067060.1 response regulator transcription factor [Nocardia albiluteola]